MKLANYIVSFTLLASCGGEKKKDSSSAPPEEEVATEEEDEAPEEPAKPMNLTFISPTSENILLIKNYVEIEVGITDPPPSTKWNLYYTTEAGNVAKGVTIVEGLEVDQLKFTWDTSFTLAGTYYLYATLSNSGMDTLYFYDQPFEVGGSNDGNAAPTATISFPIGDSVYAPGDTVGISFVAYDPDKDPITGKLEYTTDGSNWISIADSLDLAAANYDWTIDAGAPQSARYRLRLTVTDTKSETIGLNDSVFGVTAAPVTFEGELGTAMEADCNGCHSGPTANAAFATDVFTGTLPTGISDLKASVLSRTRAGAASPMPPSGTLSDSTRDKIQLWIWGGGLQN